jgi:hypothetical protein
MKGRNQERTVGDLDRWQKEGDRILQEEGVSSLSRSRTHRRTWSNDAHDAGVYGLSARCWSCAVRPLPDFSAGTYFRMDPAHISATIRAGS